MLNIKQRPVEPPIVSKNPLALATLTNTLKNGQKELVEWTSVRQVRWALNKRLYIRHTLEPIEANHIGPSAMKSAGLGLDLKEYDIGCRLVVDVPVNPLPDESMYDLHIEG